MDVKKKKKKKKGGGDIGSCPHVPVIGVYSFTMKFFKFEKNLHLYIVSVLVEEEQLWGHWTSAFGGK